MYLLEVADAIETPNPLLNDLANLTIGRYSGALIDSIMVLNQSALCIAYLVFVTSFIKIEFSLLGIDLNQCIPFLVTFLVIIPLSIVNNIHYFHRISLIGMVFAFIGISLTIYHGWSVIVEYNIPIYYEHPIKILNSFSFIGVGINCFEGIPTVLPIRNSMFNKFDFKLVFRRVMFTLFVIVLVMQQLIVMAYGKWVDKMFVFSVQDPIWQFTASMNYCISILFTYPMIIYPATQILERIFNIPYSESIWIHDKRQLSIRMMLTLILFSFAIIIPNFAAFLNLIGSVFGTLLQYIIPCLINYMYFKRNETFELIKYGLIIGFSTITIILGCWDSFKEML